MDIGINKASGGMGMMNQASTKLHPKRKYMAPGRAD